MPRQNFRRYRSHGNALPRYGRRHHESHRSIGRLVAGELDEHTPHLQQPRGRGEAPAAVAAGNLSRTESPFDRRVFGTAVTFSYFQLLSTKADVRRPPPVTTGIFRQREISARSTSGGTNACSRPQAK